MNQDDLRQTQLMTNKTTTKSKSAGVSPATQKATQTAYRKKKPVGKMLLFGAMSLSAYALLFSQEALVTNTYTLGGWYAVLPVATAFEFSFIHGEFERNLLCVLGLEPKK